MPDSVMRVEISQVMFLNHMSLMESITERGRFIRARGSLGLIRAHGSVASSGHVGHWASAHIFLVSRVWTELMVARPCEGGLTIIADHREEGKT